MKRFVLFICLTLILTAYTAAAQESYDLEVVELPDCVSSVSKFENGYCQFTDNNGKHGFLNSDYEVAVEPEYDSIEQNFFIQGIAVATKGDTVFLIDEDGSVIFSRENSSINGGFAYHEFNDAGYAVIYDKSTRKYAFIDVDGNIRTDFKYTDARTFSDGLARVETGSGVYNYVNENFDEIIPDIYDYVSSVNSEGRIAVGKDGKYGYVDYNGNLAIPLQFDNINPNSDDFNNGIAVAYKNGKLGLIDINGNEITPFIYDSIQSFGDYEYAKAEIDGKINVINRKGETVYEDIGGSTGTDAVYTGILIHRGDETLSLDRTTGKLSTLAATAKYSYTDGARLELHGDLKAYSLIDENENIIRDDIPTCTIMGYRSHDDPVPKLCSYTISEGMIAVCINDKWGYMNVNGETVIEPMFNKQNGLDTPGAEPFNHGYARVSLNGEWKTIDKQGNLYDDIEIVDPSDDYSNSYIMNKDIYDNFYIFYGNEYMALRNNDDELFIEARGNTVYDDKGDVIIENCLLKPSESGNSSYPDIKFYVDGVIVATESGKYLINPIRRSEILSTDIIAYIDGAPIRSYNIDGYTGVIVEDLRDYGFEVNWNEDTRTLSVSYNQTGNTAAAAYIPEENAAPAGSHIAYAHKTDIKTYVSGDEVAAYNIGGETIILIDELSRFGEITWDEESRSVRFTNRPASR
ncbi:MAG TPA: WG repeat-containing protein [Firmicutes bacterium]|nr:WG repeat-containing protein [Bacillota bacterium]